MTTTDDADATQTDLPTGGKAATAAPSTGAVLLLGGLIGATAALVLLLDKLALIADPSYVPSCNIDPLLSCGSIMRTAQAEVLGFPNPIIGVATFPVVAVVGALVLGRARLPGWCWLGLQFGVVTGAGFVAWLITQSVAVIGSLCPWCMLVWVVTISAFWFVTAHNLAAGHLEAGPPGRVVARHPATATAVTLLAVLVILIVSFPSWFGALVSG